MKKNSTNKLKSKIANLSTPAALLIGSVLIAVTIVATSVADQYTVKRVLMCGAGQYGLTCAKFTGDRRLVVFP